MAAGHVVGMGPGGGPIVAAGSRRTSRHDPDGVTGHWLSEHWLAEHLGLPTARR